MDQELRVKALTESLKLHAQWLHRGDIDCRAELQIVDIIHVADTFYNFLKGDNQ